MLKSNNDLLNLSHAEILKVIPDEKRLLLSKFIKELNRREYEVRFEKSITFDEFEHREDHDIFGHGFQVNGNAVPYFHPNRSFHDEIIWLNEHVFYNPDCKFEDKLINAAIVKFYGPSNTISILTRNTGKNFIVYERLIHDDDYVAQCMKNIHDATDNKEKIFGTTELRTSLQTESRNYTRQIVTPYDKLLGQQNDPNRKGRSSDIFHWFRKLGPEFKEFYSKEPTMEESFKFLTSFRGIGNYYGYHFSTNLARMPKIGTEALLREGSDYGKLDEDDDFVAPGVGAMNTIKWFFEHLNFSVNDKVGAHVIRAIKEDQNNFFDFKGESLMHAQVVSETGKFTTFGCEISCCQFSVFQRLRFNEKLARKRSDAPIGKEVIGGKKPIAKDLEESCVLITEENMKDFTKLPENYNDPFPELHLKDPNSLKRKLDVVETVNNILTEELKKSTEKVQGEKRKSKANIVPTDKNLLKALAAKSKASIAEKLSKTPKKKKKSSAKIAPEKIDLIKNIIEEIGLEEFSHSDVLEAVQAKGGLGLKLDSNWKESWAIMQEMVKQNMLEKNGRKYKNVN